MHRTTIYIPNEIYELLREKSFKTRKSMTQIILDALEWKKEELVTGNVLLKEVVKSVEEIKPPIPGSKESSLCEHYARKGYCKKGCK